MTRNEKRAELIEKINDLITYCRTERIPAFFAADFDPTGQREMITRSVTPAALNINLSDDAITQFSLLENKNRLRSHLCPHYSKYNDLHLKPTP